MSISWLFLLLAGFFEICFTIALKFSQGFTRVTPTIITIVFIILSFYSVSQAMKVIPIGTAYAVWAGIGAAGTVVCGILFFGDSYHIIRLTSIFLIILGIIGLKIVPNRHTIQKPVSSDLAGDCESVKPDIVEE
jgi:quaternary ammonium compound-resistance protein SugE